MKRNADDPNSAEKRPVLVVFGTRPEAIKMAPVIRRLQDEGIPTRVCNTGQHTSLLDGVLELFHCKADYGLDIMKPNQSLADITSSILEKLGSLIAEIKPRLVLVHGDTTTTFSATLAATYAKIPVGHVEAGLRSYDVNNPWPEEYNRRLTSVLSRFHFAPTERARQNLLRENVADSSIFVCGNTIIDALQDVEKSLQGTELQRFAQTFNFVDTNKRLILSTFHRRENHGRGIQQICEAIKQLVAQNAVQFIIPVHPNPNVFGEAQRLLGDVPDIFLVPPLDYPSFVYLMKRCYLILTDSGGIQEEAPAFGKPVLVLRETTERPEAMEAGVARLVGSETNRIVAAATELLNDRAAYQRMADIRNPFGDGTAALQIARIIQKSFS